MAQRRKNVVDHVSCGNAVDKADAVQEDDKRPLLESRCLLASFGKKIRNWQINNREWALLRRTPFGKLIKNILKLDTNMEIVDALLGFWDEGHCGFLIGGVIIPFTVDDIALITGLPNRGEIVVRQKRAVSLDREFSTIYLTKNVIRRRLDNIIRNRNDHNPETDKRFVQQMILFLWVSVLFPRGSGVMPRYMAYYVKDLDSIGSYNWAEALHSFLVKEINAKSKVVKERNEGKEVPVRCMLGLSFTITVWFFEHVDFGEDSRPSNPEIRPRMLRWAKICKFWRRKGFLDRLRDTTEDKVCYRLLPKNNEFGLISLDSVEQIQSQIGCSDGALRDDPSLVVGLEAVDSDIRAGSEGMEHRGTDAEKKKQQKKVEKKCSSEIASLTQVVLKQIARISVLERKIVNLETLAVSNGWEIEGMNDKINGKVGENIDLTATLLKSCIEGDTVEFPTLSSIATSDKQISQQHGKRKKLKSTNGREHLMIKRRREVTVEKASIPSVESLTRIETKDTNMRKGTNMPVNLDDYASPMEKKVQEASVASLNYVGRELLTENVRDYLDAFCIKPMQRDDIVFFDWNICIRRHSMLEYLQGGYTSEEIIDAYALMLYEGAKMSENKSASFLYVPPMFLGLYRNKLGSYKSFLNAFDKKSLENAKLLLLPCHISTANHWLLLVCNMKLKKWIGYDSLYDARHREAAKEKIMLLGEYLHEDHGLDIRSWSLEYRRIYPQQEPGTLDCGIFVMKFMESIVSVPMLINFRGSDMQLFRPQIAYQILHHC